MHAKIVGVVLSLKAVFNNMDVSSKASTWAQRSYTFKPCDSGQVTLPLDSSPAKWDNNEHYLMGFLYR